MGRPAIMTRGEIQIVVFLVLALLTGAIVQWWRHGDARSAPIPAAATPAPAGWAKPPYVFKSSKEVRAANANIVNSPDSSKNP
jgi:hypothetical protein